MTPATPPMIKAAIGLTNPAPGVMATKPATAPEIAPKTVGLPKRIHSTATQPKAAAAEAKCVATNALVAKLFAANALPPLKPTQPTQSKQAPMKLKVRLCGFIASCGNPTRLPTYNAQTSAEIPE